MKDNPNIELASQADNLSADLNNLKIAKEGEEISRGFVNIREAVIEKQPTTFQTHMHFALSYQEYGRGTDTIVVRSHTELFARLPHPVTYLYSSLKVTIGTDYDKLLSFVSIVVKIKTLINGKDDALLQSLFPYTRGLLEDKLTKALVDKCRFYQFHERIITELIPHDYLFKSNSNDFFGYSTLVNR